MKYLQIFTLSSVVILFTSLNASAARFDFIAPSSVNINQGAINNIGTTTWGLLIATEDTITLQDLENVIVSVSFDNPNVAWGGGDKCCVNKDDYAPLLPGEVAGTVAMGPITDNSSLLALLDEGETLKIPDQLGGRFFLISLDFTDDFLGVVNMDYNFKFPNDNENVKFTTQLNFVPSLPNGAWWEITEGVRLTSTNVPAPPAIWLLLSGIIGFVGIAKRKSKNEPKILSCHCQVLNASIVHHDI